MPSARMSALGGTHAALADDFYSLFTNPASFIGNDITFSVAELSISTYGPVFEIAGALLDHSDDWDSLDMSGIITRKNFAAGLDVGGPLAVGMIGNGLGLGLFSRMKADAHIAGIELKPIVSAELLFVSGYSYRLVHMEKYVLDAGFLGKGFFRAGLDFSSPLAEAGKIFDNKKERPFTTVLGFGLDLGIKYTRNANFSAALVWYDVCSPAITTTYASMESLKEKEAPLGSGYASVLPRLGIGVRYRLHSMQLERFVSNILLLADYRNIFDVFPSYERNPLLAISFGTEVTVLEKLKLRFGFCDALPSAGIGIDLSFMQFDCSVYGKELGQYPGEHSIVAADFALLFRY